tara:strand:- start:2957 stop:3223 length:267 start_codon:yes stop_codon:yes gene_type:complete
MRKKTYIINEAAHSPARLSSPVLNNITNRTVGAAEDKMISIGMFSLSRTILNPEISDLLYYSNGYLMKLIRIKSLMSKSEGFYLSPFN